MNRPLRFAAILSALSLCACNPFKSSPKVVLPETQPLETGKLGDTAQKCKKEVDSIEERDAYVPKERKKEFETTLSMASDTCDELVTTYERLKSASHQIQTYQQNIQHARATMVEGRVVNEESPAASAENTTDPSTNYGFEDSGASVDVTPADSAPISDEPLS